MHSSSRVPTRATPASCTEMPALRRPCRPRRCARSARRRETAARPPTAPIRGAPEPGVDAPVPDDDQVGGPFLGDLQQHVHGSPSTSRGSTRVAPDSCARWHAAAYAASAASSPIALDRAERGVGTVDADHHHSVGHGVCVLPVGVVEGAPWPPRPCGAGHAPSPTLRTRLHTGNARCRFPAARIGADVVLRAGSRRRPASPGRGAAQAARPGNGW
jgi:hypothetical protein